MNTPLVPFQAGSPIIVAGPTGSGKHIGQISCYQIKCLQKMCLQFYIAMEFIKIILMK